MPTAEWSAEQVKGRWFVISSITVCILIICLLLFNQQASLAQSGQVEQDYNSGTDVHALTDRIVDLELEFLKLNTQYRIATNDQSKFRSFRQFLYNMAASSTSLAGSTTVMANRWSTNKPNQHLLEAGAIELIVGQAIVEGGIVVEKLVDMASARKARANGLSAEAAKGKALALKQELDSLLLKRKALLASMEPGNEENDDAHNKESLVLFHVRDLCLIEFSRFYADQFKRQTSRDVSYINGMLATASGGYGGSLISLLSATQGKPSLAMPAGIGFIVSSATVMASPYINKYFAKRKQAQKSIEIKQSLGELSEDSLEKFESDLNSLSISLVGKTANADGRLKKRLAVYAAQLELFSEQHLRESQTELLSKKTYRSRTIANAAIAAPKMAWGVMLITAGAGLSNNPVKFNTRVAEAATVYTVSQSVWVLDSLRGARSPGSLKFTIGGQVPFAVKQLVERIDRLDQLDKLVKQAKQ